jgi:tetratricopeptide (TPR) repeat protein/thiol-disulfide isomerase/thioredoxin
VSRFLLVCVLAFTLCGQSRLRTWAEAENVESESAAHPDDVSLRVQLIRYYFQPTGQTTGRVKPLRRKHIVWMIEHHPENSVLLEPAAFIGKSGQSFVDPDAFAEAEAAWRTNIAGSKPLLADAYANGAQFFKTSDPTLARQLIEKGLKLYPGNAAILSEKGTLLAYAIARVKILDAYGHASAFDTDPKEGPDASRARKELELATDANLLGGAAQALLQQTYTMYSTDLADRRKAIQDLAPRLYQRAMEIDPNNQRWRSGLMGAWQAMAAQERTPAGKIPLLEKAVNLASGKVERSYALTELAQAYCNAGDLPKATSAATELVNSSSDDKSNWNYGNSIHVGNIVLGRIALKQGDSAEAATRLLAAGRTPGSPQLNASGPNWTLAQDLLANGDRTTVLSFLDLCRNFWTSGSARLDSLTASIRSGGTPNFYAPDFPKDRLIGRAAPEFRLKDLKGNDVSLTEFKGKVVLVDFWGSWCPPCRQEMPDFEKIHRELSSKDVVVLTLDVNEPQDTVVEFVKKEKYTFPVLITEGTDVVARYSVNAYPTTFAIDKSGRIADVLQGGGIDNESRLLAVIDKARAGAQAPAPDLPSVTPPALSLPPVSTADDYYRDAARLRTAKDLVGAIKAYDRVLELRKDWLPAMTARAGLYFQLKQYDNAVASWTRIIELDPKRALSYDERGLAYSNAGKYAQSIPDYTRAIELDPNVSSFWNGRGWAYLEMGRYDASLSDLDKAIELNPAFTTALFNRAHLYSSRKEYARAIADFDAILRVTPADSQAAAQKADAQRLLNPGGGSQARLVAPKLLSPDDRKVFDHYPRDTTLVWSEVPGAVRYIAEWDYMDGDSWHSDRASMGPASLTAAVPVVSFQFVGAQAGRWRVCAVDAAGNSGPKSEWREFRYTK